MLRVDDHDLGDGRVGEEALERAEAERLVGELLAQPRAVEPVGQLARVLVEELVDELQDARRDRAVAQLLGLQVAQVDRLEQQLVQPALEAILLRVEEVVLEAAVGLARAFVEGRGRHQLEREGADRDLASVLRVHLPGHALSLDEDAVGRKIAHHEAVALELELGVAARDVGVAQLDGGGRAAPGDQHRPAQRRHRAPEVRPFELDVDREDVVLLCVDHQYTTCPPNLSKRRSMSSMGRVLAGLACVITVGVMNRTFCCLVSVPCSERNR